MFFENINYITVAVSALAVMGLGFIWYAPWFFGGRWIKEMGLNEEVREIGRGMAKIYAISFFSAFLTAFVLSALLNSLVVVGIWGLVLVGFSMWAGFSLPVAVNRVLYGRDSLVLLAINSGYQIVSLVLVALIVGIFG